MGDNGINPLVQMAFHYPALIEKSPSVTFRLRAKRSYLQALDVRRLLQFVNQSVDLDSEIR